MTNVERVYNELLISKSKQRQIENLLQEVRMALQNGEEYHHIQLERKMLNIIANVDYDHHMVEDILQAYMKDRRWAEIFPALYGDMLEHQSFWKGLEMEHMKFETSDMVTENIDKIAALFPSAITEMRGEDGEIKRGGNFEVLKQLLSRDVVDGDECYEFTWVGKKAAMAEAARPITKTLRPVKADSRDWDTTENLYIEGDNLEVLKILQESYLGKIKMIYIDPPYNTGNDFIYADDFMRSQEEENGQMGMYDEDENRLFKNADTRGRFHSDWCSMIYSRLMLARNLLADDGVIFISVGDEEVENLRKIADEVFGEANFRNQIIIRRGAKSLQAQFATWDKLGQGHEYILFYTKNSQYRFPKQMKPLDEGKAGGWNNHWRGTDRPTMRYELFGVTPDSGQWRWSKDRSIRAIENYKRMLSETGYSEDSVTQEVIDMWYAKQPEDLDLLRQSSNGKPEHYIAPTNDTLLNSSWMDLLIGSSSEIGQLFDTKVFDTAKLTQAISRTIKFTNKDALILDFFSGSATTAHAVMQLNAEDGGHRKFIMVQLPEKCDESSEAYKAGYKNICEIGKERIRRAGDKIQSEHPDAKLDTGFRVFRVDESNMEDVYYHPEELTQTMLGGMVSNIKPDRTDLDLLYACLLDWGVEISLSHTQAVIDGCTVHNVDNGALCACFDERVPLSVIDYMAKQQPLRAVFRDSSFAADDSKINVTEIFKNLSPDTKVKVI